MSMFYVRAFSMFLSAALCTQAFRLPRLWEVGSLGTCAFISPLACLGTCKLVYDVHHSVQYQCFFGSLNKPVPKRC